jgi:hypothetical protein
MIRRFFHSTIKKELKQFISTWNTSNTSVGSSASNQVRLPLVSNGNYNFVVDWGDGSSDVITTFNQAEATHTYANSGNYTITITGTCVGWRFNNGLDRLKILTVVSWGNLKFTNLSGAFFGCSNLTSISGDLSAQTNTTFQDFFWLCGLTSIPSGLFDNCPNVTNFAGSFFQNQITSIPSGLFDNCPNVTTFGNTFNQNQITSIPSGLFDNCPNVTSFSNTFQQNQITSIPAGLFDNCHNVTTFTSSFFQNQITSIPSGLFDNCPNVTIFSNTFRQNQITSIPSGIFDNCPNVTTFANTFQQNQITSIPAGLFDNCPNVTNFAETFLGNSSLNVNISDLVLNMDMTKVTTTRQMFSGCSSIVGNGQDLIDKPKAAGFVVSTAINSGSYRTFFNCTSLNDFATIPAEWK